MRFKVAALCLGLSFFFLVIATSGCSDAIGGKAAFFLSFVNLNLSKELHLVDEGETETGNGLLKIFVLPGRAKVSQARRDNNLEREISEMTKAYGPPLGHTEAPSFPETFRNSKLETNVK